MSFLREILADSLDYEGLAHVIEKWVSEPSNVSFMMLRDEASNIKPDSPLRDSDYGGAYRGIRWTPELQKNLSKKNQKIKIPAGSWTYDEDEAIRFAKGYPKGLVIYRSFTSADIVLNLQACIEDAELKKLLHQSTIDTIRTEGEIVLTECEVTKDNVEIVEEDEGDDF